MPDAPKAFPRAINHFGINVPDLDAAVRWYVEILGFEVMIPPMDVVNGVGEPGQRLGAIAGPGFGELKLAYLATANGVGIEMFEFVDPRTERFQNDWEYWRPGLWHIGITDPDLESLVARIVAAGGSQKTAYFEVPKGSGFRLVYCLDPWGNPLELMNTSYDRVIQAAATAAAAAAS